VEFPIFFSSFKTLITHISFSSSKIRIFNSGLVSNKNILSISIFNNVMRFEIYTRSVHCTFVHCRSWTQCDHNSLPCVVGPILRCSKLWLTEVVGNQTALNGVLVHCIIPIQLFQLHRHHMECSLQKVNTHSTLLIPLLNHHKDIKNHHLHSCSLLNSFSLESKYIHNSKSYYGIICWDGIKLLNS